MKHKSEKRKGGLWGRLSRLWQNEPQGPAPKVETIIRRPHDASGNDSPMAVAASTDGPAKAADREAPTRSTTSEVGQSPSKATPVAPISEPGQSAGEGPSKAAPTAPSIVTPQAQNTPDLRLFESILRHLLAQGVDKAIASDVILAAAQKLQASGRANAQMAYLAVAHELEQLLPTTGAIRIRRDRCTVVSLLGPTGVGKSTTIAKLAAIAALKEHKTVALVTTDTYRIAATEQLKTYARLLGLPLVVARGADELSAALDRFANRDMVLLDTPGQNPHDHDRLSDLEAFFKGDRAMLRFLTMSATTKSRDVKEIINRFQGIGFDGLLFTKLDESAIHGTILNATVQSGRPLTYFSVGQAVPQDIEVATPERMMGLLLPPSVIGR